MSPTLAMGPRALALATALLSARAAGAQAATAGPGAELRIEPRTIDVGMFYRGSKVRVEGRAPRGRRIALVCVGRESRIELKQKGKVWNLFWRNVGSVELDRVPSLYLASADLEGIRPAPLVVPAHLRIGLGYDGVEAQVLPAGADERLRRLFREFIRVKEAERLYSFEPLRPESQADPSPVRVSAEFSLPPSVPVGVYEVWMIGYRDGAGELLASATLTARRVGLARLVSSMAERHGFLHGCLSVVVAIATGLLTGALFAGARRGPGRGKNRMVRGG